MLAQKIEHLFWTRFDVNLFYKGIVVGQLVSWDQHSFVVQPQPNLACLRLPYVHITRVRSPFACFT